jgi:general secretion pathway protein I
MNTVFRHPGSAFSLLEVIIAIAVLGIALVGLTEGISVALRSSKDSEQQSTAALFAAGVIETLRADGGYVDGETDGDCGQDLPLYRWKQAISPAGVDGLHEVKVTVENAKSGKAIFELQTLLFEAPDDTTSTSSGNRKDNTSRRRRQQ